MLHMVQTAAMFTNATIDTLTLMAQLNNPLSHKGIMPL
jgi:hypothetical protein